MERAEVELERRSRYLSSLIQQQKRRNDGDKRAAARVGEKMEAKISGREEEEEVVVVKEQKVVKAAREYIPREPSKREKQRKGDGEADLGQQRLVNVRVRAADMPQELQKLAFQCAQHLLTGMPKLDSKRLALTLKKEFDSKYGHAWHCIVGKSFGSYVTHSLGGFLYFSIDKVYILLFRTAVEPLEQ